MLAGGAQERTPPAKPIPVMTGGIGTSGPGVPRSRLAVFVLRATRFAFSLSFFTLHVLAARNQTGGSYAELTRILVLRLDHLRSN